MAWQERGVLPGSRPLMPVFLRAFALALSARAGCALSGDLVERST